MANKKIIIVCFSLLLLSGCGNKKLYDGNYISYTLDFNNSIKEDIDVYMPSNAEDLANDSDPESAPTMEYVYLYDNLTPLIDNNTFNYTRSNLQKNSDYSHINLQAEFDYNQLLSSNTLNRCFESTSIEKDGSYLRITLGGEYFCSYGDRAIFNVKGNNIVFTTLKENGLNNYVQEITRDNIDEDIILVVDTKQVENKSNTPLKKIYIGAGIILLLAAALIIVVSNKIGKNNY